MRPHALALRLDCTDSKPQRLSSQAGMTLVEIMVVLAILAGLGTVLINTVSSRLAKSRVTQARIQIGEIKKNLELYYTDCGTYPSNEAGLSALVEAPSDCKNWGPDPYMKNVPKDPWNSDYIYELDGSNPVIMSLGEDRREGGTGLGADISSEDL